MSDVTSGPRLPSTIFRNSAVVPSIVLMVHQFLHQSGRALICRGLRRTQSVFRPCVCQSERNSRRYSMYASGVKSVKADGSETDVHVVDMRSDTVTTPTEAMRAAMAAADVGDDVFGEDPAINALQVKAAQMLEKDSALFVPSGTMGNLISIMAHCGCRGSEMLVGDNSHIVHYEQGGAAQIGGVHTRQVHTFLDGTLDLSDLESKVHSVEDPHYPHTRLICLEQTHANYGGRVLPLDYFEKVKDIARSYNLKIHVDGARLFHAAAKLSVPPSKLVEHVDSVSFCLSKGLGAPVGSVVAGSEDFIGRCLRHRKVLGGGMRQAGVLAAAGIYALENMPQRLHEDHNKTSTLAQGLQEISGLDLDLSTVETNMVFFHVTKPGMTANELVSKMGTVDEAEDSDQVIVKMLAVDRYRLRVVLHHQVSEDDVTRALKKFQLVMER